MGPDDVSCYANTAPNPGTATCNGDGNGMLNKQSNWNWMEYQTFFQHLANAGLIAGQYSKNGAAGDCKVAGTAGVTPQSPASPIATAGYGAFSVDDTGGSNFNGGGPTTGYFLGTFRYKDFGLTVARSQSWSNASQCGQIGPGLTGSAARAVDTKLDDGAPGTGRVRSAGATTAWGTACGTTDNPATAAYPADEQLRCNLLYLIPR